MLIVECYLIPALLANDARSFPLGVQLYLDADAAYWASGPANRFFLGNSERFKAFF
jgi:hypothetical protein